MAAQLYRLQGRPARLLVLVGQPDGGGGVQHLARGVLGQLGQADGLIHGIADDRVLEPVVGAGVPGDYPARGDVDARVELQVAQFLAELAGGGQCVAGRVVEG